MLLAENWWAIALRGLAGILFGIMAFLVPWAAVAALVLFFGAYALADGIFGLISAVRAKRHQRRWGSLALRGILGIAAGVFTFIAPAIAAVVLVSFVGAWAVITGALEIASAIRLRKVIRGEWLLGLAGVLSVVFGVLLWVAPRVGALALAWWIGAYMLVEGVVQMGLSLRLRKWAQKPEAQREDLLAA